MLKLFEAKRFRQDILIEGFLTRNEAERMFAELKRNEPSYHIEWYWIDKHNVYGWKARFVKLTKLKWYQFK